MHQHNKPVSLIKNNLGLNINKRNNEIKVVALGGNPNVGKSTVFNELTGLKQHTGNWPGKTVENAQGNFTYKNNEYIVVDLPGSYSLMAHSVEEEIARDFICFGGADAVIIVCDATCLERNLILVLQAIEINPNVVVCINLMDEAKKKKIKINLELISQYLGVPVVGTAARSKYGLKDLLNCVNNIVNTSYISTNYKISYPKYIEEAIELLQPCIEKIYADVNARWLSIMLMYWNVSMHSFINKYIEEDVQKNEIIQPVLATIQAKLIQQGITQMQIQEDIVSSIVHTAEEISKKAVIYENKNYKNKDIKIDKVLTGKWTAFPIMMLALIGIFWLTLSASNYPSQLLSNSFFWIEDKLLSLLISINCPKFIYEMLVFGIFRVLGWVVSVMLPPMAIFFPLFTLLEDVGYLPRIAFNLDKSFKKCSACGKQALTMCMGFGCNAVGVTGCRIIDSPRERLIAIITNTFVPCNGRFPILIAIISMFFIGTSFGLTASILSALFLTAVIILGIAMTFFSSKFLSKTFLKGIPSSFTLELPPFRKPQIGKVIIRSIFDRTLFVLGRAVIAAVPAGLIIFLMANVSISDATILVHCTGFLDPFAKLLGLDGVILIAFILGFPANEIVIPIIIMAYMSKGSITQFENLSQLKELLVNNGWTWLTAVSVILFSLMHWPCSTTCITIRKETKSWKWTGVSIALPTIIGMSLCFTFTQIAKLIMGF